MTHADNFKEIEKLTYIRGFNQRIGYLKACKQTEKEVEALKNKAWLSHKQEEELDKIFTHKQAIKEAER